MFQNLILVGNLGRDPEMRYLPDGKAVTNFSMATNREWPNNDGTKSKETTWFRISAFGRLAEVCNQYLHSGDQVLVEGHLIPDKDSGGPRIWTGTDGVPRASFEVRADTVKFINTRRDGDNSNGNHRSNQTRISNDLSSNYEPDPAGDEFPF